MNHFDPFEFDFAECQLEITALKDLLQKFQTTALKERRDVLTFFRENRNIAALAGHCMPNILSRSSYLARYRKAWEAEANHRFGAY
jgi:hypothetical protein